MPAVVDTSVSTTVAIYHSNFTCNLVKIPKAMCFFASSGVHIIELEDAHACVFHREVCIQSREITAISLVGQRARGYNHR